MVVIVVLSSRYFGGEETGVVFETAARILLPTATPERIAILHAVTRKLAPVTAYATLAGPVWRKALAPRPLRSAGRPPCPRSLHRLRRARRTSAGPDTQPLPVASGRSSRHPRGGPRHARAAAVDRLGHGRRLCPPGRPLRPGLEPRRRRLDLLAGASRGNGSRRACSPSASSRTRGCVQMALAQSSDGAEAAGSRALCPGDTPGGMIRPTAAQSRGAALRNCLHTTQRPPRIPRLAGAPRRPR